MKVKDFEIEQTGGYVYVAWGSFENNTYFSISSDILVIYDEDEYKLMYNDDFDAYTWEQEHIIESYSYECEEFKDVLEQLWERYPSSSKFFYDLFQSIDLGTRAS